MTCRVHVPALCAGIVAACSGAWPVCAGAQTQADDRVTIPIFGAAKDAGPKDAFGARVHLAAMCGASWLVRNQRPTGRYLYRRFTAVNRIDEQDNYLRQAGCAYAVARAGRYSGDDRYTLSAKIAIRALLGVTQWDRGRRVLSAVPATLIDRTGQVVPGHVLGPGNRFGGSALLLLAMSELDDPSEFANEMVGLSRFLEGRQDPLGWFRVGDRPGSRGRQSLYPGEALLALVRAYKHTKRDRSLQAVMQSLRWYRQYWNDPKHQRTEFYAWQCSAISEAYLVTRDPGCVEFVKTLTDWMLRLQYRADTKLQNKPVSRSWVGGFGRYVPQHTFGGRVIPGRAVPTIPRNNTGSYAEGLADACRLAKAAGDGTTLRRYQQALVQALTFLMGLQYTADTSRHFAAQYMPLVYGGVHESVVAGNLRCDYTQHAACAWLQYLMHLHQAAGRP